MGDPSVTIQWAQTPGRVTRYRIFHMHAPKNLKDRVEHEAWKWRKVHTQEGRVKRAMLGLILLDIYPSPTAINAVLQGLSQRPGSGTLGGPI